ncbi:SusD/RagB family nutrient-binding outer membrane lipoprotein [Pedobacter sp. LMG 31464]|uniref:SusD/RagB family nutrient-binding outer membrane lipoprotein n=1 Tax=Pedobacter planticolens TaxID=2679964 RepID=A0A923ITH3_9SPHI|nr:SusD/RagB family nutrient-binding outer membrane lipoprotein [Pedobacter planticolens]MBB2144765.1 SusD/RagB family nutrient-binding outer membrane lipoprotein [Pedobacter planticolens]
MKKIKNITSYTLLLVVGISFFSCKKDFNEINTDPIGVSSVTADKLLAPALTNILSANLIRNRSINNELMQVTVDISDAEGKVFRYDVRRALADAPWNAWYLELTNLRDINTIASQAGSVNKSYQGISRVAEAWAMQLLTDTYGDVPYTEAGQGKLGNIEPVFDKQKDIYLSLFSKLEEANTLLAAGEAIVPNSDPVYAGDIAKWRRFGNSLYLRLLLRISRKTDVSAQVIAKIKEMIDTNPAKYPIMENNTHTAKILWNGTNSSTTVYSSPYMINVRVADFRAPSITDFFLGTLSSWADPRINQTYGKNNVNRWGIAPGPAGYVGIPSGYPIGGAPIKQSYFYSDAQVVNGITLQTDPYTGVIMNVAEVDFILAEAAARGWINGTGETYYYKGVADAINYWIPSLYANGNDAAVRKFATDGDFDWSDSFPLDNLTAGSLSKLQLIHSQKYYALFLVDFEQWFEYRRTAHPFLPKGSGLANGGKMPARLQYPILTQSTNPTNYKNAVAAQGPDDINTLIWWQKP